MAAPIQIIDDDDDEFDWDAAVQEIEVACKNAGTLAASSSHPPSPPEPQPSSSAVRGMDLGSSLRTSYAQLEKPRRNHRQLKLERFLSNGNSKNHCKKHIDKDRYADDSVETDETDYFVKIDPATSETWIYPENIPPRDYQMAITKTALFSNTLVVLPTGLGKTLIAAVVMYNYFRWFPEGKIVFAAPSRPLVLQQIQACHKMVGIPQESTIDLTGLTSPSKRACLWKEKRVFFVTPQVLERDIQSGACLMKYLICLVIDEAHRATGNFSFCVAVRELLAVPVQLRILALTATPGSKQQKIQDVIDNLHISTLEYRDESDDDVSPYVHNRKIELMKVPMSQTAVEVTNLLSDVMRPIAVRLSTMGVLQNRDVLMLSPCDLLNSREKFRQAPPPALSHVKYGEVEGCFGVLITLYHIRKLLSGHGVKPAYEMLEDKLRQGPFAKFMSRNEIIQRVKLLMQQNLSHGAPSPKLSKMIEVLVDHFEKNDPENSRVIIFSNFRGSVRDIMDSLAKVGGAVKATQFIGQSAGKVLKGQTQKVQQAVLQKFRTGGYNVIVATSIGEEGLDIMEVDLVICFDANISPLRMIQRMGRTGRKHDGRVVVLACEGAELKGYLRKQSSGKAMRKHMRNGGMNSFKFHSSSRMVPHIFKPEMQLVKLAIEKFVPRGRSVKDDSIERPITIEKLNDAEAVLLAKYFGPKKTTWKPSLIAFPHFQAFPSRVHSVMHSSRTGMLIDLMQHIQGISFSEDGRSLGIEASLGQRQATGNIEQHIEARKEEQKELSNTMASPLDVPIPEKSSIEDLSINRTDTTIPHGTLVGKDNGSKLDSSDKSMLLLPDNSICEKELGKTYPYTSHSHTYLFGSEVASVDISGRVLVSPVPVMPFKELSDSKSSDARSTLLLNFSNKISCRAMTAFGGCEGLPVQMDAMDPSDHYGVDREKVLKSQLSSDAQMAPTSDAGSCERIRPSPPFAEHDTGQMAGFDEAADVMVHTSTSSPELDGDAGVLDLSPRLTNFIESGFVPESPLNDADASQVEARNEIPVLKHTSSPKFSSPCTRHVEASPAKVQVCTPVPKIAKNTLAARGIFDSPPSGKHLSPLQDLTNCSCSKDWYMNSGKKSGSTEQTRRFKRLRKIGDTGKKKAPKCPKENSAAITSSELAGRFSCTIPDLIKHSDEDCYKNARDLIDDEAQVCTSAEVSADEEDDLHSNSYEDSFIDDGLNPTAVSPYADDGRIDMMAVYRRSLLSQSPITRRPKNFVLQTPESVASVAKIIGSGGSSEKPTDLLQTNERDGRSAYIPNESNSVCSHIDLQGMSIEAVPSTTGRTHVNEANMGSRKRKLSSTGVCSIVAINLEKEVFSLPAATASKELTLHHQDDVNKSDLNEGFFSDDQFYASLDLDALEAQATKIFSQKADSFRQKEKYQESILLGSPSFDLGIS